MERKSLKCNFNNLNNLNKYLEVYCLFCVIKILGRIFFSEA